ncbi:MAG: lectin like domain-containing protein [Oscillospiraceae bacterium]
MKKFLKSFAFTLISMQLILSNSVLNINADENRIVKDFSSLRFIGYENTESIQYNAVQSQDNNSSYPSKYDLRELGLVTSTNNQDGYGMCWTFATTQSVMSRLLERNPYVDLSEWHLGYFTYNGDKHIEMVETNSNKKFYNKGGSSSFATAMLSRWVGFVSEDVAPYGKSMELDESLNYASEYHLTDAYCMNSALNDNYIYSNYSQNIKDLILNGSSIMTNIYYKKSSYYSQESNSYYCSDTTQTVNHGVTIVGWDDDFYSYDGLDEKPKSKGAWLIKNTYGYEFGDYGYFWLSYENTLVSDMTAYMVDSNENYSTNYSPDSYGWVTSVNSLTNEMSNKHTDFAGNVFTSTNDEDLSAIGIYTTDYNTDYTVYIYKNLKDESSPIGELVQTFSGTEKYSGFHTIPLENPVPLETGEKFSIVVKYHNPNYKNTVAIESAVNFFNIVDGEMEITQYNVSDETILQNTNENESFVSNDGNSWTPTRGISGIISIYDTDFKYSSNAIDTSTLSDGVYGISTLGNACIKAFTNPHDKVYFSQYGGNLYLDESIELSSPVEDATIYYTIDGSIPTLDSPIYTEPIQFNGEDLIISARVYIDGVLGETYTETFTQLHSVLSTLCIKEFNGTDYTFTDLEVSKNNQANTIITYTCNDDAQSINLYPISSGNITINGNSSISGHETDTITIGESSSMTIPIQVTKDGCIPTEYTLIIENPSAKVDDHFSYVDVLSMKKYLLGISTDIDVPTYDLNSDNTINLLDYTILKDLILNQN